MTFFGKSLLITSFITLVSMTTAQADTVYGVYGDVNYWHTSVDSELNKVNTDLDNEGQVMASLSVEHPVPFVPNVRLRYTTLNADALNGTVKTEIEASSTDAVAYYELFDNIVSLDVGLGAKIIDGDYKVTSNSTDSKDMSETLPMAYASVGSKFPLTGLSAKAELGVAKSSDVDATDAQAEIKYNFVDNLAMDMGAKIGYRIIEVQYDDDKTELNTDFKGPYIGLEAHF